MYPLEQTKRSTKQLKKKYEHVSRCGRYYCPMCDYFRGGKVRAAKNLLYFVERSGSLRLIAQDQKACNFNEFLKGLRWLASQDKPCKGCRSGGGWSWWPDCPVRDCTAQRGLDFCYQCADFPCKKLKQEPLLPYKTAIIETNNRIKKIGIERHVEQLKELHRAATTQHANNKTAT